MSDYTHNPDLQKKINQACLVIEKTLDRAKRPCLISSFDKDSVLLIHMVRSWFVKDIDVVFFRQPWFPRKYAYADKLAAEWELTLHSDIAPRAMNLAHSEDRGAEIVMHYGIGQNTLPLILKKQPIECRPKWLCGRDDILRRITGTVQWPWDIALHPRKSPDVAGAVDVDQILNACDLAYPLRSFTDADVWECFRMWDLPVNTLRYKQSPEGWVDDPSSSFNPDYHPYCADCLDRTKGPNVLCPKSGLTVSNLSPVIPHMEHSHLNHSGGA